MQEIAAKHIIYRPRKKNQNNQLKKVNVVASGKEEFVDDKKRIAILEPNTYKTISLFVCIFL